MPGEAFTRTTFNFLITLLIFFYCARVCLLHITRPVVECHSLQDVRSLMFVFTEAGLAQVDHPSFES